MKVEVSLSPTLTEDQCGLVQRADLQSLLEHAGDELDVPSESTLAVLCTNDQELARLNLQFAGEDHATDVLSFAGEGDHVGDIAISVERAIAQAEVDPPAELRLLSVHGLLHCLGHDHADEKGARVMSKATRKLLPDQAVPELEPPK